MRPEKEAKELIRNVEPNKIPLMSQYTFPALLTTIRLSKSSKILPKANLLGSMAF
jgi:hypothetical protein